MRMQFSRQLHSSKPNPRRNIHPPSQPKPHHPSTPTRRSSRQRTLGDLTHFSKCDLVQGKLCGDFFDITYGEKVIEANQNPDWVCPVCRGICSCSVCLKKGLVHDDFNKEMDEECLGKDVNILSSEHVPAEDICKLDSTIACDAGGEAKIQSSTEMSSTDVGTEDLDKLMTGGDVVDVETKKEARSTRTSFSHVAEDLGSLEAATDVASETKTERRSTRMRKN